MLVLRNGNPVRVPIQTGITDGTHTAVVSGLQGRRAGGDWGVVGNVSSNAVRRLARATSLASARQVAAAAPGQPVPARAAGGARRAARQVAVRRLVGAGGGAPTGGAGPMTAKPTAVEPARHRR